MRISASIARQSTSLPAAAAAESNWAMVLIQPRSSSTSRRRLADQPSASAPPSRTVSSAWSSASSVPNRMAISSRRENGSSTAPEAAREKPGVPALLRPRRCAGRHHRSAYRPGVPDLAAGAGGARTGGRRRPGAARRPSPAVECATGRRRGAAPRRPPRCAPQPKGAGVAPGAMRPRPSRDVVQSAVLRQAPLGRWPKRRSARQAHRAGASAPAPASGRATAGRLAPDTHRAERARCSPSGRGDARCTARCRLPRRSPGTRQSIHRWSVGGAGPRRARGRARARRTCGPRR